jgi:hypothetical protein
LALSLFSFASLLLAACLIHACVLSMLVRSRRAADTSNLKPVRSKSSRGP